MAFKMKGSPMARNYGAPFRKPKGQNHSGEDHTNASHKSDASKVRRAKGTEAQEVGNLLNVLEGVDTSSEIYSKEFDERAAERKYYEDSVRERDPNISSYRGDYNTDYRNSEGGKYISQMDAAVDFEKGQDEQAAEEKAKGNWYDESRSTSVEGREMAKTKAGNQAVIDEANKRTQQHAEGIAAQARIDAATAEDAEEARYNALSPREQRQEDRAKAKSAVPKSGFKMHRKGNFGK